MLSRLIETLSMFPDGATIVSNPRPVPRLGRWDSYPIIRSLIPFPQYRDPARVSHRGQGL